MLKSGKGAITLITVLLLWTTCVETPAIDESDVKTRGTRQSDPGGESVVATDVLFLVLGKMALYDQSLAGEMILRNHHFVAEIMPKKGRKMVSGTLTSSMDASQVFEFKAEGNAFLAHGSRVMDPEELHRLHPDGEYVFSYETQSGHMEAQAMTLTKRPTMALMPPAAPVTLSQNEGIVSSSPIDPDADLSVSWESVPGNTKVATSELDDLVFVLGFDCFGNNFAHSGRPYQGGRYPTYEDSRFLIPASSLRPGLRYTLIVEQATADVQRFQGVPGIATYATLTFVGFETSGVPEQTTCPSGGE